MNDKELNSEKKSAIGLLTSFANKNVQVLWAIVIGHTSKHLFNGGIHALILPKIKIDLGLNKAQFGALNTVGSLSHSSSTIITGALVDRYRSRANVFIGLSIMLMGIATFTASFISTYQLMLLAILFMSIGPSMFHPPALGELARRFPNKRGLAVSMHGFGANIGEVLGPITIAGLLLIFVDWRDIMRISIVPAALISIGLWIIIDKPKLTKETSISSLSEYFKSLLETLRNKTMIVLIIAISLKSIGEGAVGTYIPLYLIEELGIDEIRIGLLLSLAQTMGIISQPIMGNLSDTKGRKIVMLIGTGCVGLLSIGLAVMAHPSIASIDSSFVIIGLWAIIIGKGAFTFSLHHIYLAAALDVSAAKTQSSIVAIMYGSGIISTFSPYLAGLMADKYGFYSAFLLGGIILVVAALVLLFFKTTKQQINS